MASVDEDAILTADAPGKKSTMSHHTNSLPQTLIPNDYSLTGVNAALAVEKGLAEADWYQCAVPRETMRALLVRRDGPAIRDTFLWFALIFGAGFATWALWGSWWAILPYAIYSVLYASTSDSRWHESGHGTAFKTDWMNNALYEIASFMVMRESTVWRWSHNRHHSDTIIVGRDPEIAVPRPPDVGNGPEALLRAAGLSRIFQGGADALCRADVGRGEDVHSQKAEFGRIYWAARIYAAIYLSVIALSIYERSILPLLLVGLTNLFGSWLMPIYGLDPARGAC